MSLNAKIRELEQKVLDLQAKVQDLSRNTEESYKKPITVGGGGPAQGNINAIDFRSGQGGKKGGPIIWNESEIDAPYGTQPTTPKIGYNKHSHSRYSGGALIKDVLEIVEYEWGAITNKHSQGFLKPSQQPQIKKMTKTEGDKSSVDMIGLLNLTFDPNSSTWGVAAYEIDVKKCYLVEKDSTGQIVLDSKGNEKKSSLYNEDQTKTAIVWDENSRVWRFYSVYASGA